MLSKVKSMDELSTQQAIDLVSADIWLSISTHEKMPLRKRWEEYIKRWVYGKLGIKCADLSTCDKVN